MSEALNKLAELSEKPEYESVRYIIEREQHRLADLVHIAMAKGIAKGMAESIAEGKLEGMAEAEKRIAQILLDEGFGETQAWNLAGIGMSHLAELVSQMKCSAD